MDVTLRLDYSAANTARVSAVGGRWDAMAGGYVVPETATALIAADAAAHAKAARAYDASRASRAKSREATKTAGRLAGYSDAEIDSALRSGGGDDL